MADKIWYVSYGSNILEERFLSYITGSHPKFLGRPQIGALDQTPPKQSRPLKISHRLYFAHHSKTWDNGGVAFIEPEPSTTWVTLARAYLITEEQFRDVFLQENGKDPRNNSLKLSWEALEQGSSLNVCNNWYGRLLRLNDLNGLKCFTFTSPYPITESEPPSKLYIQVIARGIMQSHGISFSEVADYFYRIDECRSKYSLIELRRIIEGCELSI